MYTFLILYTQAVWSYRLKGKGETHRKPPPSIQVQMFLYLAAGGRREREEVLKKTISVHMHSYSPQYSAWREIQIKKQREDSQQTTPQHTDPNLILIPVPEKKMPGYTPGRKEAGHQSPRLRGIHQPRGVAGRGFSTASRRRFMEPSRERFRSSPHCVTHQRIFTTSGTRFSRLIHRSDSVFLANSSSASLIFPLKTIPYLRAVFCLNFYSSLYFVH